jgi:hypothetical protein
MVPKMVIYSGITYKNGHLVREFSHEKWCWFSIVKLPEGNWQLEKSFLDFTLKVSLWKTVVTQ